ncbi:hypothetical protein SEVIR_7G269050v4 [Setaria viridis]|uniref:DUF6598 domain-containing protein n=1 Tax=Setaria viridis TaxID=4556 RepID=A0A4U6TVM8_SETVI|nr:hypothetical protein SEVIR_7G269050v2 [Setaria viridis]
MLKSPLCYFHCIREIMSNLWPTKLCILLAKKNSPVPPLQHTNETYQTECRMHFSANILSVKVVSSDIGFPIHVYGTVIARDSVDKKCVYLFRCHRRDSQLIKSEVQKWVSLWRRVIAVCLNEKLMLTVDSQASNDIQIIQFGPSLNGASQH